MANSIRQQMYNIGTFNGKLNIVSSRSSLSATWWLSWSGEVLAIVDYYGDLRLLEDLVMSFFQNIASYSCRSYPITAFIGLNMLLVGSHLYVIYFWFMPSDPTNCLHTPPHLLSSLRLSGTICSLSISLMGIICRLTTEDSSPFLVNIGPPWLGTLILEIR